MVSALVTLPWPVPPSARPPSSGCWHRSDLEMPLPATISTLHHPHAAQLSPCLLGQESSQEWCHHSFSVSRAVQRVWYVSSHIVPHWAFPGNFIQTLYRAQRNEAQESVEACLRSHSLGGGDLNTHLYSSKAHSVNHSSTTDMSKASPQKPVSWMADSAAAALMGQCPMSACSQGGIELQWQVISQSALVWEGESDSTWTSVA